MANDILKEALIMSMNKEIETIPPYEELMNYHEFSNEFDKKMKSIIRKANIKYVNINKLRVRKSIVAASLIIIIVTAFMHVEAVRLPVIKLTEKIYTKFSEILFNNEKNIEVPETIEDVYVPSYIPEGYTLFEEEDMKLMHFLIYSNEKEDQIFVEQFTLSVSMAVDTEGITTEEITINEMSGIIYTKKGLTTIIVNDNNYVHLISGYESREELIKVAESLYIRE